MKRKSGFTLVEMVVVIVLLGGLAATTVPKFAGLQKDARVSALKGAEAVLKGGANLVYSKALIERKDELGVAETPRVRLRHDEVTIVYGYPMASQDGIIRAAELADFDVEFIEASGGQPASAVFTLASNRVTNSRDCQVIYREPASLGSVPLIMASVSGC